MSQIQDLFSKVNTKPTAPISSEPVDVTKKITQIIDPLPNDNNSDILEAIKKVDEWMPSNGFLVRIANSESNFGKDPNTYRPGYYGGVFQVDKIGFEDTKNTKSYPKLNQKHQEIKDVFGIDWNTVTWQDLQNPLYSAIAARLYLSNKKSPIPSDLNGQADYWKRNYNSSKGKGSTKHFLDMNER